MSISVVFYQIVIAAIILGAAWTFGIKACFWAAIAASVWTLSQVHGTWLLVLQFCTIIVSLIIGIGSAIEEEGTTQEQVEEPLISPEQREMDSKREARDNLGDAILF